MKRKSASFLAGVLVASMVATPLSYTNVYAEDQDVAEIVQQVEDTSGESENVQESAPAKEESKEEVKAEENATPAQPEASQKILVPRQMGQVVSRKHRTLRQMR